MFIIRWSTDDASGSWRKVTSVPDALALQLSLAMRGIVATIEAA